MRNSTNNQILEGFDIEKFLQWCKENPDQLIAQVVGPYLEKFKEYKAKMVLLEGIKAGESILSREKENLDEVIQYLLPASDMDNVFNRIHKLKMGIWKENMVKAEVKIAAALETIEQWHRFLPRWARKKLWFDDKKIIIGDYVMKYGELENWQWMPIDDDTIEVVIYFPPSIRKIMGEKELVIEGTILDKNFEPTGEKEIKVLDHVHIWLNQEDALCLMEKLTKAEVEAELEQKD